MAFALGKRPARHDPRTLRLGRYLLAQDIVLPDEVVYDAGAGSLSLYDNDRVSDCTAVSAAHLVQMQQHLIGQAVVPTLDDVHALYQAASGYDPTTGQPDNGAYLLDVLKVERQAGIAGKIIHSFAAVDARSVRDVRRALFLFGGLRVGLNLPLTAQAPGDWDVVAPAEPGDDLPGSWGGHAVTLVGYDEQGPACITWGERKHLTWAFWQRYADEAYACLPADWQERDPFDMLDWDHLNADLAAAGQVNGGQA